MTTLVYTIVNYFLSVIIMFGLGFILCSGAGAIAQTGTRPVMDSPRFSAAYQKAYRRYPQIPRGILEAFAHIQTRNRNLNPDHLFPSCSGLPTRWGIFGWLETPHPHFRNPADVVISVSDRKLRRLKRKPEYQIEALARTYQRLLERFDLAPDAVEEHGPIWAVLSDLPLSQAFDTYLMDQYLYEILVFLNNPELARHYRFPVQSIEAKRLFTQEQLDLLQASMIWVGKDTVRSRQQALAYTSFTPRYENWSERFDLEALTSIDPAHTLRPSGPDYGPALWDPIPCNFSSRDGTDITSITIHTVQGSYGGCISWFHNCSARASAHYVVRSRDGQITQMVRERDKAWHLRTESDYTVGIEHEGWIDDARWYTTEMYRASAHLVRDIADRQDISVHTAWDGPPHDGLHLLTGCYRVKGHQHYPRQTHTDPGPFWDWERYYGLLNPEPSVEILTSATGTLTDPAGPHADYGDDVRKFWRIAPPGARQVSLQFDSFDLESGYDFLTLYDGPNRHAPVLGTWTGHQVPFEVTARSGQVFVDFYTDCATTAPGFLAAWQTDTVSDCLPPEMLDIEARGHLAATLNWSPVQDAEGYELNLKRGFAQTWTTYSTDHPYYLLNGLAADSRYEIQVRAICSEGTSPWLGRSWRTPIIQPHTLLTDCDGVLLDTGGESGNYRNDEAYTLTLNPGGDELHLSFEYFEVFSDVDRLQVFDGTSTQAPEIAVLPRDDIHQTLTGSSGALTLHFTSSAFGNARGWKARWWCVGNPCDAPSELETVQIGSRAAVLRWAVPSAGEAWRVAWRIAGDSIWSQRIAAEPVIWLDPLQPETIYEVRVTTLCEQGDAENSAAMTFQTNSLCFDALEDNDVSSRAVDLRQAAPRMGKICPSGDVDWFYVDLNQPGTIFIRLDQLPTNYNVELYRQGQYVKGAYKTGTQPDTLRIEGLPGRYLFHVYGYEGRSDDSGDYRIQAFVTEQPPVTGRDPSAQEQNAFRVFPNPVEQGVWVRAENSPSSRSTMILRNLQGQIMIQKSISIPQQEQYLDLERLPAGVYLLSLYSQSQPPETHRIIKK